ncbi:DUF1444 domain-containing protein [Nocardia sp. IFM 10818]
MGFLGGGFGAKERARFGQQALAMVRGQSAVARAEFEAGEFRIDYWLHDGEYGRIDLTTVFKRCRGVSEAEAAHMLFDFVAVSPALGGAEQSGGWGEIAPRLRPLVRQADSLAMRVEGMRVAEHSVWRPVLPCLMESVVVDLPTSMRTLDPGQVAEWGLDMDAVFATARANLAELALDTVAAYDPGANSGMLHIPDVSGDLYAGSLPLVDGWLAGIGAKAGARPIVFIAENVGVLVGAEFSEQHVLWLVNTARRLFDDAVRPVSPMPYTIDAAGGLIPYRVRGDHAAWREIRSAEATLAAAVYGGQYEHLRADLDAGLTEDRAAKLMHVRSKDGVETTVAPWTDTVPTLLPKVGNVTLTNADTGETFGVTWEILAAAVDLRPVPGIYPPRFRVEHHPDPEVMGWLRSRSGMQ